MGIALPVLGLAITLCGCGKGVWFTPDQQGDRLMEAGRFEEAASGYEDIFRKGVALYRAGDFEAAQAAFAGRNSAEGHFNRGNALVFRGKYEDAMAAYDRALALREGWPEAEQNREIARLRAQALEAEGGEGTGGKLGADEVVFDDSGKKGGGQEETVEMATGESLSDEELRALWLRNVQTRPADFLRSKFAYQLIRGQGEGKE
jgi:Ca-activated chloride channel family protein